MAGVVSQIIVRQPVTKGTTSYSVNIYLTTTAGVPVAGKAFDTANLIASYFGEKLARVAITLADLAAVTTAWASGGFKEIDATNAPGWYRLDVPNLAMDLVGGSVTVTVNDDADCSGCVVIPLATVTVATAEAKIDIIDTLLDNADLGNPLSGTLAQNVEAIGVALPGFDVTNPDTTRTDN